MAIDGFDLVEALSLLEEFEVQHFHTHSSSARCH